MVDTIVAGNAAGGTEECMKSPCMKACKFETRCPPPPSQSVGGCSRLRLAWSHATCLLRMHTPVLHVAANHQGRAPPATPMTPLTRFTVQVAE